MAKVQREAAPENLHGVTKLSDIDHFDMLVHLRHVYLECAKDFCKREEQLELSEQMTVMVLGIQSVIEEWGEV